MCGAKPWEGERAHQGLKNTMRNARPGRETKDGLLLQPAKVKELWG